MPIQVFSTLTGRTDPLPSPPGPLTMYVCGMTPKFHPHLGHARIFVALDAIRRYLEFRGYQLRHVQNFTDIDDKIIQRAAHEAESPQAVAEKYSRGYFDVMDSLGVERAHNYPKVTEFITQIVEFVAALVEKGYAYAVDGDVYFEVGKFPAYGALSGRTGEGQLVGARKELEPGKRDPRDFSLWKRANQGEPSWPSPWGRGRPGWHIECSTMARETLGDQIEIHAGARDLIFPHHENEIAQSEARTGKSPFARHWLHVGLVTTSGEKMSHSLENFTTARELLHRHHPMALRLYLLSTHYRSPIEFSEEALRAAGRGLRRLRGALGEGPIVEHEVPPQAEAETLNAYCAAMDDDFGTASAVGQLFDLAREINRRRERGAARLEVASGQQTLLALAGVLGLRLERGPVQVGHDGPEPFIDLLVEVRQRLREAQQWKLADQLRVRLRDLGVAVADRQEGPSWSWIERDG